MFVFRQSGKYVRITMNVALVGQTIIEPPADGNITRDNISCKVSYQADGEFVLTLDHVKLVVTLLLTSHGTTSHVKCLTKQMVSLC